MHKLSFLAEVDGSARIEALTCAAEVVKDAGGDPEQYKALCEAAGVDHDSEWVSSAVAKASRLRTTLERNVNMKMAVDDREGVYVRPASRL